jgi:hypothetical protein
MGMNAIEISSVETPSRLAVALAYYAACNTAPIAPKRAERLARAIELGASHDVIMAICDAGRTSTTDTIILPAHRFENLSRGRGWARKGRGDSAVWGERADGGYRVSPGKWVVGGNDGFSRKGEDAWTVTHIQVGSETWTVAS